MRVRSRTRLQMHAANDVNRWTVSLADFMTLMFAVFVVLYAVSLSKEDKYEEVMQSIQDASKLLKPASFNVESKELLTKKSNTIIEDTGPELLSEQAVNQAKNELSDVDSLKKGEELGQLKLELEKALLSNFNNESIRLDLNGDWLTIEMGGSLLFVGGSHTLLNSAKSHLEKLAQILKPVNNMLRIRGYTDQQSISNEIYQSNWELAGARAFAVLHELNSLGIAGERMVMEAYGQYDPVIDNKGNIDKQQSRRVVIAISKYALIERQAVVNKIKTKNENLPAVDVIKPDSDEMHELHLPNNRLIITTRQE